MIDPFDLPDADIVAKPVKPEAAIAFWQSRAALTREQARALEQGAGGRAFFVSGLTRQSMVQEVMDALGAALENGETFRDFQARMADLAAGQGWQADRLETVFRNNMATAYMAGRWAGAQAAIKTRPYAMYATAGDERVRPSHTILSGKIYPLDHPFWAANWPPNGHRCRCDAITMSERQVKRRGLTVETEMPGDGMWTDPKTGMEYHVARPGADDGWRNNPGKSWVADLTAYAVERLEEASPEVRSAMVRRYVSGGLDAWAQKPEGVFPLVALPQKDVGTIGSKAVIGRLSAETWKKQTARHPELTTADYALAQDAVEKGTKLRQDARNMAYALDQPGGVVVVVKATRQGNELYVTSLRRMSREEAERERTIRKLEKGK